MNDYRLVSTIGALACLLSGTLVPQDVKAQITMSTITNPPTACVGSVMNYFVPSKTMPTATVGILKVLTVSRVCGTVTTNSAFCNPGFPANTMILGASAMGAQISMSPSCSWACAGCANISTDGSDDLPIELMDFGIDEE